MYSIGLFWINDWQVLLALFLADLLIILIYRRRFSLRKNLRFLLKSFCFVAFVVLLNLPFRSLENALLVGARLMLALETTFLISRTLNTRSFARGFYYLLSPLRFAGVDVKDLALTIVIALSFVPILSREATVVRQSLKAKGFDFNLRNLLHRPQVYVSAYIDGMFDQVEVVEKALRGKGWG